jgi:hypothetical protein
MKVLGDKIFIIENFISVDTANFLVDSFTENIQTTVHPGIYSGPGQGDNEAYKISGQHKIKQYDSKNNIAIDIMTSLCPSMEKVMSNVFNKKLQLKSISYVHMKSGGKNDLHYDNYSEEYKDDYSGILYLTDKYLGGALNFPNNDIKIEPKIGDFICFVGDKELEHEVQEVIQGDRVNLVCFFNEKGKDIYANL